MNLGFIARDQKFLPRVGGDRAAADTQRNHYALYPDRRGSFCAGHGRIGLAAAARDAIGVIIHLATALAVWYVYSNKGARYGVSYASNTITVQSGDSKFQSRAAQMLT